VFGNVDIVDDIIHPGAFSKTLQERGDQIRVLWSHDGSEPIGKPVEMREDEKGLYVKAMISDTRRGRDALALLKDGAVDGLSIGYDPIEVDYSAKDEDGEIRNLRELRLWEFSIVAFPANEAARVLAMKEAELKLAKAKEKAISLTDLVRDISDAFVAQFPDITDWEKMPHVYVCEVFDTHVIVAASEMDYPYYQVDYQGAEGGIQFASMEQWIGGDKVFTPGAKSTGEKIEVAKPIKDAEGNVVQVTNYNLELKALTDKERAAFRATLSVLQGALSDAESVGDEEEGEGKQQDSPAGAEPSVLDSLTHSRKLAELRRLELEVLEG
jgi:HK97 family phage prohead protease